MYKKTFITVSTFLLLIAFFFAVQPEIIAQTKKDKRNAEKLVSEGNRLFNQNDFKSAIAKYAEAITMYPGYAEAHFWKGSAHSRLEQNEQAIYDLDIALQQGYKPLQIYRNRWFLYYQKKDYDAALKDAQSGLQLEPDTTFFKLALGDVYRAKRDFENAVLMYEKVASIEQANSDLSYYMAVSYKGLSRYEKQRAAANEAIRKGTKFPGEAWYLLGDSYLQEKNYEMAIEPYERALTANKDIYEAYVNLAETYRYRGDYKKAISTLNRGIKVFDNDGGFLVNLTWYNSLAGNNGEAIREGQKAIKVAPGNSMAFTNLCRAYSDSGLHKQALDTCKEALKINSNDGETHYYMARAYNKLGQSSEAVKEYKLAVQGLEESTKLQPDNTDGIYLLGGAYYGNEQFDEAIGAYREVIKQNPRFSQAYFNLAYTYQFKKNDKKVAMETYEKLKEIDPKLADDLLKALKSNE